MKPTTELILG